MRRNRCAKIVATLGPSSSTKERIRELADYVRKHAVDVIYIALPMGNQPRILHWNLTRFAETLLNGPGTRRQGADRDGKLLHRVAIVFRILRSCHGAHFRERRRGCPVFDT